MKKRIRTISFLLTIVVLTSCFLACCATTTSTQQVADNQQSEPGNSVIEHQPYAARGDNDEVFIGDISDLSFVFEEEISADSFPVFLDKYPTGQEGALFQYDQSMIDMMTENLIEFMKILYDKDDVSEYAIEQFPPEMDVIKVFYESDSIDIYSDLSGISVGTSEFGIVEDIGDDNLLENTLIQAALKYMNIDNPKTVPVVVYNESGEIYQYQFTITEATEDFFENVYNNSFSYIKVIHYPDSTQVLLIIRSEDISEQSANEQIVTYEEAEEYIRTNYDVPDDSSINAEIYYSSSVREGYYVPCYKFYVEDSIDDTPERTAYDVVHIPMTVLVTS